VAVVKVTAEKGADYVIKLVNVADAKDQIVIFLRGGESSSTKVPLGRYRILGASGHVWYGRDELFGTQTRFFRLHSRTNEADPQVFQLRQKGNTIYGLDLSLKQEIGGTLGEQTIARADF
jgi:hypothetical protein